MTVTAPVAHRRRVLALALSALLIGLATFAALPQAEAAPTKTKLTGLFKLKAGSWVNGKPKGTYFRMLQPDGKTYLANTSVTKGNQTVTHLKPGTDGGLKTGVYQSNPKPAFASNGDARSGRVTSPVKFYGVKFSTSTNKTDPQTGRTTKVPVVYATGSKLTGDVRAFAASWNGQHFNQGSPKPDGTRPGITKALSGIYNKSTKAFTIVWRSKIVGGPFNNFTGEWHLAGTFVPAKSSRTSEAVDHRSATALSVAGLAGLVGYVAAGRRRRDDA